MGRHRDGEDVKKRIDVWLNERHQETIKHAKKIQGGTAATAIKAGLELLRRQMKLDVRTPSMTEADDKERGMMHPRNCD